MRKVVIDGVRRLTLRAFLVSAVAGAAVGCVHRQAAVVPAIPLDVPPPPPRVVEVGGTAEVPQPVGLIGEPTPAVVARPRATPLVSPRQDPPRPEAGKPDVQGPEQTRPPDEPRQPSPALQTTPSQQEAELEASVRGLLGRANADLGRIDYRNLGANARTQYETAKGFIKQSEDALKAKNLPFASSLADKAAALAAQLAGR